MTDRLKRGEVWLTDLNPTQGSEQAGIRPVIIFQSDSVLNFIVNFLAGLVAYTYQDKKPSLDINPKGLTALPVAAF